ncbi:MULTISPECIES: hypothetical protein [Pseudomonas syringae group]|nr:MULTISPECIES: hypothetical protein [Pseudomonas syringae group]MBI6710101.1 hypothetical protein [Pseudomonas syringae]
MTMDKAKPPQPSRWPQESGHPTFIFQILSLRLTCQFNERRDLVATETQG